MSEKAMKVGMYYRNSDVRVEEKAVPAVGDDDILIKVMASGICGTDLLEWYRIKRAPLVLGHEPAGEVVEVGKNVERFKVGGRVFSTHHVPCDECRFCRAGHETACKTFQTVNNFDPGGFSQFLRVTGRSLATGTFLLPDEMTYDQGSFIEPVGTAVRGMRAAEIKPAQSVLVLGSGIAGMLLMKMARAQGAGNVIATDLSDYRLEKAREFGANYSVKATEDIPAFVREVNDGRLADKVILCAGVLSAAQTALQCVEPGGILLFFAVPLPGEKVAIDFNPFWRDDITIKTCYGAAPLDNMRALELIRRGVIDVDEMITHRYGIDEIGKAYETAAQPSDCLKVILRPNG